MASGYEYCFIHLWFSGKYGDFTLVTHVPWASFVHIKFVLNQYSFIVVLVLVVTWVNAF